MIRVHAPTALIVAMTFAALTVPTRAVDNWASEPSLGDVAISFTGHVTVYDNANATASEDITLTELTGSNGGLQYDSLLNLVVTNTAGTRLTNISPTTHQLGSTTQTASPPKAIAIAADGTIYVASLGTSNTATIQRFGVSPVPSGTFTVPTDSISCIGIDLSPDQSTLFYVSGGRNVSTVTAANTSTPVVSSTPYTVLPGNGTACGIRLLPPVDERTLPTPPATPLPLVGGVLVGDTKQVTLVTAAGVSAFDTGNGSKQWIDVAIDPDTGATPGVLDFWAVNAGSAPTAAKFRIGSVTPLLTIALSGVPGGIAINGELRAAQTVQPVLLANGIESTATFLQNTQYQHLWRGLTTSITPPAPISLAVQAIEVTQDKNEATCGPLNVDCRVRVNFASATRKTYSRGRGVVYREIRLDNVAPNEILRIGFYFPGPTDLSAGTVCTVGGTPRTSTDILRDPWPHLVFTEADLLAFYGGDDGGIIRTKTNDSLVVDRSDAKYFLRIIKPAQNTEAQIGRSLQIAVEVRDPANNCNFVSGLNNFLILTVTDITLNSPDKGKPVGDSQNIFGPLNGNGLAWASTANQYRTNLDLDPPFVVNHKYRACIEAPSHYNTVDGLPLAGESCVDFLTKP